jgi:hypothetical protein
MRRAAIIACVVGALPGCFYYESINQRPAIEIENLDSDPKSPGDEVNLRAVTNDPDGDFIELSWRVYTCTDAEKFETEGHRESCDEAPFFEKSDESVSFTVPALRAFVDQGAQLSAESALVILEAKDEYGATARPRAQLIVPIINMTPTLVVEKQSKYDMVEGTPVRLIAKIGDDDDGPERLTLNWVVNPPTATGFVAELVDGSPALISDPEDPAHLQHVKVFTANDAGEWTVDVTVSDPLGNQETQKAVINVIADQAPCLAQLSPLVPPAGFTLPMSARTLFRVPVVRDDLDPYPLIPDDEIFRATRFRWSIQNPGTSTHTVVAGATSNALELDPDSYTPGDVVEVRVEIFDRNNTPIPCPDAQASCSTISQPSCLQRQTWRVEVR